jgi:predicted AlkP superfamily pyrophosphatase or phosphodiesterase
MRKSLIAAAAAVIATTSSAQPQAAPTPPRLVIVISVDQFSADLFDEYRPQFTGGFARLAGGTVFRNGYQSHAATETCPGHSTLLTGDRPSRTGIVANLWIDQSAARADKSIYCAEDERVPGSTSTAYKVSPLHLKVPTLGELMKARWPASRNVAVSGKDRSAVMMSGHSVDQRWYWDGKTFATDLAAKPPVSVAAINTAVAVAIATARGPLIPPPFCTAKAQPIPIEGHGPVGSGTFSRAAGDTAAFRASPEADGAVLAMSAALIREMQLGHGASPDLLSIGLAATDYVGHTYGPGGQEMCLQLISLDRDLGDFLAYLDRGRIDYSVVLTADHGAEDIPERLRLKGIAQAQRVDPALTATAIGKSIATALGLSGPVLLGDVAGDIYVDRTLTPAIRLRTVAEAVRIYRAHRQVAAAFTHEELAQTPLPGGDPTKWSLIDRARASFDPERSGDLVVMLKEHVTPIARPTAYVATHGSPWDYDRRVPILFWRSGTAGSAHDEPVETVDIMPTVAASLGVPMVQGSIDGKCLNGVAGVTCPLR